MAKHSTVNINTTTNGGAARMFATQQVLVAAGWVVRGSSDGTTYKATVGSQITHEGTGAGGMNNNSAWYWVEDPGGRRGFTVQRGTNDRLWRFNYSALDRFITGSPSATRVPTAADAQILFGAGTDAAPTFSTFAGTAGSYYAHVLAQSTPEGDVYPFWTFSSEVATGTTTYQFYLEPMAVGSYPSADPDPCVVQCTTSAPAYNIPPKGWYNMNGSNEQFVDQTVLTYGSVLGAGNYTGSNPYTGNDDLIPIGFARGGSNTPLGWKGFSKYLCLKAVNRNYPDTVNLATDAYVYVGEFLFPWENGTTPSI